MREPRLSDDQIQKIAKAIYVGTGVSLDGIQVALLAGENNTKISGGNDNADSRFGIAVRNGRAGPKGEIDRSEPNVRVRKRTENSAD